MCGVAAGDYVGWQLMQGSLVHASIAAQDNGIGDCRGANCRDCNRLIRACHDVILEALF